MDNANKKRLNLTDHMGVIAFGLAVVYWFIEAFMTFITIGQLDPMALLLGVSPNDIEIRIVVLCLLAIFGSHAQYTINSRKHAEKALQESEERYRTLVQNLPIGIIRTAAGLDGHFLMANPAFLSMMGMKSEKEIKNLTVSDIYADIRDARSFVNMLLGEKKISWIETELRRIDGTRFWGMITAQLVTDEAEKNLTFFDCTIKDITDRKDAEKRIAEQDETRRRFERLLSPDLAEMVVSGELNVSKGGEIRFATIMFADIRGFTAMSETAKASDILSLLNEYYEEVVEIVFLYEGTVDKFIGDEIMVLWGAPISHDDDPARAIRAALDIQSMLKQFNESRPEEERIEIGIGINTGHLVAGYIGSTRTMSYSVIGDTVNTASRICSAAQPGQIIISESTFKLVEAEFEMNRLEPIKAKGKRDLLKVYEVNEDKLYSTVHLYL